MAYREGVRVQQLSNSLGSGALLLTGTVSGMVTFDTNGFQDGDTFRGLIEHTTTAEWEISPCTFKAGTPNYILRGTPYKSSLGAAKVVFSAGNKTVSVIDQGDAWTVRNANYAAKPGDKIRANTVGAGWTLTLAAAHQGDVIEVVDDANTWPTNPLLIAGFYSDKNLTCDHTWPLKFTGNADGTWKLKA